MALSVWRSWQEARTWLSMPSRTLYGLDLVRLSDMALYRTCERLISCAVVPACPPLVPSALSSERRQASVSSAVKGKSSYHLKQSTRPRNVSNIFCVTRRYIPDRYRRRPAGSFRQPASFSTSTSHIGQKQQHRRCHSSDPTSCSLR